MKLIKIKLNKHCQLIAVTDNADMVLTAGAFTSEEDTETASDVLFTLLCNLGLLKKEDKPSPIPLSVLLEQIGDTAAVYVKELVDKE